ncbi:Gfo/Idh/MocA family oxidoreductase [Actinopolymorpha sp. B9G3]|uniref:Gfo/Idh/MocA family protein n=1 Tax=Actinopolymorpha sp. B9G3 TaxID=3158970 RepID=UPI0032D9684C
MRLPRVGLVGVNGYGRTHLRAAAQLHLDRRLDFVAYADIAPGAAEAVAESCSHHPMGYPSLAAMLAGEPLDIAILATPIPLHAEMIEQTFAAGVSVLVEKPPVVTIQDLDRLVEVQRGRDVLCQVGFQTARAPVTDALGDLARTGALGEIELVAMIGRWQRSDAYYARTGWAGRLTHQGRYVLDGTLTNPFAHGLMNALMVAGRAAGRAAGDTAVPATVRAELYRCRDIEGDDTASVRITTTDGHTIIAVTTLCAEEQTDPRIVVRGTSATATAWYTTGRLTIDPPMAAGLPADVPGDLPALHGPVDRSHLLVDLAEVVGGRDREILCPLRMCRGFVLALSGIFESAGRPRPVSPPAVTARFEEGARWVALDGVDALVERCARDGLLFSETGADWAAPTREFPLADYTHFDLFS